MGSWVGFSPVKLYSVTEPLPRSTRSPSVAAQSNPSKFGMSTSDYTRRRWRRKTSNTRQELTFHDAFWIVQSKKPRGDFANGRLRVNEHPS
jgi:hypothetical protein